MNERSVIGFVFARGGSKGVPRKNIRLLAGKPLISYAIDAAFQSKWIDRVVVSTDCEEIAQVARDCGAEVPFLRPASLASDTAPEWHAWRHAILEVEELQQRPLDVFVAIPTTAPLRSPSDIDACIELLLSSDADIVVTASKSQRSPYFNMVLIDEERTARLVNPPPNGLARRQDAPPTYDMATVAYAARRDYVLNAEWMFYGDVKAVEVPAERAWDIDTELDFQIVEFLMEREQRWNVLSHRPRAA